MKLFLNSKQPPPQQNQKKPIKQQKPQSTIYIFFMIKYDYNNVAAWKCVNTVCRYTFPDKQTIFVFF